jgi:hypothetical protein
MTVIGTVLPFSAISGRSSLTLPSTGLLPPVNSWMTASASFYASAGVPIRAMAPAPSASTLRRLKSIVNDPKPMRVSLCI